MLVCLCQEYIYLYTICHQNAQRELYYYFLCSRRRKSGLRSYGLKTRGKKVPDLYEFVLHEHSSLCSEYSVLRFLKPKRIPESTVHFQIGRRDHVSEQKHGPQRSHGSGSFLKAGQSVRKQPECPKDGNLTKGIIIMIILIIGSRRVRMSRVQDYPFELSHINWKP